MVHVLAVAAILSATGRALRGGTIRGESVSLGNCLLAQRHGGAHDCRVSSALAAVDFALGRRGPEHCGPAGPADGGGLADQCSGRGHDELFIGSVDLVLRDCAAFIRSSRLRSIGGGSGRWSRRFLSHGGGARELMGAYFTSARPGRESAGKLSFRFDE